VKPEFPLLAQFCRGYLHQDLVPAHGSPRNAATAYLADLSQPERTQLAQEAARFRSSSVRDIEVLNRELRKIGSMWNFGSVDEFEQVLRIFERGH
jgi:CdiI immunity protein